MTKRRTVLALLAGLLIAACTSAPAPASTSNSAASASPIVYLVRHAEKMKGDDPSLTEQGRLRAEALADTLEDEDIQLIFSTNYARTLETAAPLAARRGLEIILYDPGDLPGFADTLRQVTVPTLVVGHSNTTPDLVTLLGGDGGKPIIEATEYDRLYAVRLGGAGPVSTLDRYGE